MTTGTYPFAFLDILLVFSGVFTTDNLYNKNTCRELLINNSTVVHIKHLHRNWFVKYT